MQLSHHAETKTNLNVETAFSTYFQSKTCVILSDWLGTTDTTHWVCFILVTVLIDLQATWFEY